MNPCYFRLSNKTLEPSGRVYSTNVTRVDPLNIWTDGEQCVSCWSMSWRERISALFFGKVWVAVLSGNTQPPICVECVKEYLREANE